MRTDSFVKLGLSQFPPVPSQTNVAGKAQQLLPSQSNVLAERTRGTYSRNTVLTAAAFVRSPGE